MESTSKEIAKDPSSVKLSNIETCFSDDSLCIIHTDLTAKNGLGVDVTNRYEYIFINSNGKNYESFHDISNAEEEVYVTAEKYNAIKKGKIYEQLSYEAGIRYLAAINVNSMGREVGVKNGENFSISVPTGTGSWEVNAYKDEFGEDSSLKYLSLIGNGVFSNSATTNSEMIAILYVDKNSDFSFKLVEYNLSVVKSDDSYDFHIKDATGEIYDMILYNNSETGQMSSWSSEYNVIMQKILTKGGTITVAVREKNAYSTPDTYLFKLNVSGYEKAKTFL